MNDAELERLVADLPWAAPGSRLDVRVQATLRTAAVRARIATAVTVGALVAASLTLVWVAAGRDRGITDRPPAPLAGDGAVGGGTAPATGGVPSQARPIQPFVTPRAVAGGGAFGTRGTGEAVAVLAALPAVHLSADAAATFEHIAPLLRPVNGMAGLMLAAISGVTTPWRPGRSEPRTGPHILERFGPRGISWPAQIGRDG